MSNKVEASLELGDIHRFTKNTGKAVDEYKSILDIPKINGRANWNSYFRQYLAYKQDSNYTAMRDVLESAMQMLKLNKFQVVFSQLQIANSYYDESKYDEAGKYLEDVFIPYANALDAETKERVQPERMEAAVLLGKVYYQQKNYGEAIITLEDVLARPDTPKNLRQDAQSFLEKTKAAMAVAEKVG